MISHIVLEWQCDKVDWSEKKRQFFTLTGSMATSLEESKKRSRSVIFKQIPIIWCKDRENRSSGSCDNLSTIKKKLRSAKYIARSAGLPRFAEWAKL